MALPRRALSLLRTVRSRPTFVAARSTRPNHPPSSFPRFDGCDSSFSTRSKNRWSSMLGVLLAGPTFFIGFSTNAVYAENASGNELTVDNEQAQALVTGLRKIEDGSIVSNEHTVKWRIFTDNGRDQFMKGKLDEAEKFFQSALTEAKEGFGPRDPHVASSYNNLAELYRVTKAFEKAEPLYLEAITILEEAFGPDDIRVGAALHNLGQFYLTQRKLEEAQKCYERALKIEGRVLGHSHTDYANTIYHLAMVMHLLGKEVDSEDLIQESIRILEDGGLGETMTCMRRMRYLSQMMLSSNRLVEAENLQRKILHILELSKGWDSLDTVITAESLAITLQSLGSLDESQALLERCLDARKKILPHDHIQVASNLLHLARVTELKSNHFREVNISEARAELNKAKLHVDDCIRIAEKVLDSPSKKQNSLQKNSDSNGSTKDQRSALLILLQAMDLVGLLDSMEHQLLKPGEGHTLSDAERALRQCVSIFKEPGMRSLLDSPDVKKEYLSCLRRLTNVISDREGPWELIDEALRIEAELSHRRKKN